MYGKWWREGNIGNWVNSVWRLNQSIFEEDLDCGLFYSFKEHSELCRGFYVNSHHFHRAEVGEESWSLVAYTSLPYTRASFTSFSFFFIVLLETQWEILGMQEKLGMGIMAVEEVWVRWGDWFGQEGDDCRWRPLIDRWIQSRVPAPISPRLNPLQISLWLLLNCLLP